MTLTLPGRRDKRTPRHKAVDEVDRLRHELAGAGHCIASLRQQLTAARAAEDRANAKAVRVDEAEARATAAEQQAAAMDTELAQLRAFKANVTAVSAPAGVRDIDPDDHPTQPIPVRTLWDAHAGPTADATTVTHGEAA